MNWNDLDACRYPRVAFDAMVLNVRTLNCLIGNGFRIRIERPEATTRGWFLRNESTVTVGRTSWYHPFLETTTAIAEITAILRS